MIKIIIAAIFAFILIHLYMFHMENYKAFNIGDCVILRDFIHVWKIDRVENQTYHLQIYVKKLKIYLDGTNVDFIAANHGIITKTTCE